MIIGVGTDLVEIYRIKDIMERTSANRFCTRVYTSEEQALFDTVGVRRYERMAGSFAAKEAVVKALGVGFGKVSPSEIETLRDNQGKPFISLYGNAKRLAEELGVKKLHISISHSNEHAVAFAVAEA